MLHRISGDDGSWYRLNRTFLTELRKQFLQWRSLSPARMMEYVEQSNSCLLDNEEDHEASRSRHEFARIFTNQKK